MPNKKPTKSKKGVPLKCGKCRKFKGKSKNVSEEDKCNCGRPTKKDPEVVRKLEMAFMEDFTLGQACIFAGISDKTFYTWCKEDDEFLRKINAAKQFLNEKAKKTIADGIKAGSPEAAKWYLERREASRYSTKQIHEVAETTTEKLDEDRKDELDKLLDANL